MFVLISIRLIIYAYDTLCQMLVEWEEKVAKTIIAYANYLTKWDSPFFQTNVSPRKPANQSDW